MPVSPYLDTFPVLGTENFIHESASVIGDVRTGRDCSIWCNAVVRGDVNRILIGDCSNIQDFVMCHVSHRREAKPEGSPLIIGDHVTVGHSAILHGCTIGNECLIGMGVIVMDDAVVGDRVMVGAGSLVSPGKVLESGFLRRPARRQGAPAQRGGDRLPQVFRRALRAGQGQLPLAGRQRQGRLIPHSSPTAQSPSSGCVQHHVPSGLQGRPEFPALKGAVTSARRSTGILRYRKSSALPASPAT